MLVTETTMNPLKLIKTFATIGVILFILWILIQAGFVPMPF